MNIYIFKSKSIKMSKLISLDIKPGRKILGIKALMEFSLEKTKLNFKKYF